MARKLRKLLIVARDDGGYNIMLEIDGERTMSAQVNDALGETCMLRAQDAVITTLVQAGFVKPSVK